MKKLIIAALVGGLILWVWQTLSFAMLGIHDSQMQYTEAQDEILAAIELTGLDEGQYMLPHANNDFSPKGQKLFLDKYNEKPWAMISYHKSLNVNMGMNMIRAFVIDFVAALLLAWLLMKFADLNMKDAVLASIMVGLVGYLTISYLDAIWFETNSWPDMLDAVVQWGLVGVWMGWFLNRETSNV